MAYELWFNVDGSTSGWESADEIWFNTNGTSTGWEEATEGWVNIDGTSSGWVKFWPYVPPVEPEITSASAKIGSDGSGCSAGKCIRCCQWTTDNASDFDHHIRILRSVAGGTYYEQVDDQSIDRRCGSVDTCGDSGCSAGVVGDGAGCYCDGGCNADGVAVSFKIRLEDDGTDTLAGTNCEEIRAAPTGCGGGAA